MPEVIPIDYGKIRYRWSVAGILDEISTGIGFVNGEGQTAEEAAGAASVAYTGTNWGATANRNDEWTYLGTACMLMTIDGPILAEFNVSVPGTEAADAPPVNAAFLVRKNTALGGRRNRGRMYWPPCNLGEVSVNAAGFFIGATQAAFQTSIDAWATSFTTLVGTPQLFHSLPGSTIPTPVTSFGLQSQLATQRRRMR